MEAISNNVMLGFTRPPRGHHAFDVLDDDTRSREIIQRTLEFMDLHV